MDETRQITLEEWDEYEWHDVTSFGIEEKAFFVRGVRLVDPPDDGLKYVNGTRHGDTETRWVPALTYAPIEREATDA